MEGKRFDSSIMILGGPGAAIPFEQKGKWMQLYDVTAFGAVSDGKTICTQAIQRAVDTAAQNGGGQVILPAGVYLSGSVFLKSHVTFQIDSGACLRGIADEGAYPEFYNRVAGVEMTWPGALLNVCGEQDVHITGGGELDGQGAYWWNKYWGDDRHGGMRRQYEQKGLRWVVDYDCKRPRNLLLYDSRDVTVENLTLLRSPFWNLHVCYCEHVRIDGIKVRDCGGPSTDGVDIDSSCDVEVAHCDIDCNDDNICLKAGRDADGLRVNRPCENIRIHDCITRAGGGITLGSETSGGIRNVEISNIRMERTAHGIHLKSAATRGGCLEDIRYRHIHMIGVAHVFSFQLNWNPSYSYCRLPDGWQGDVPERWRRLAQPVHPASRGIPEVRRLEITDVTADCMTETAAGQSVIFDVEAFPEKPIRQVQFRNIRAEADQAGLVSSAADWKMRNTRFVTRQGAPVQLDNSPSLSPAAFQTVRREG